MPWLGTLKRLLTSVAESCAPNVPKRALKLWSSFAAASCWDILGCLTRLPSGGGWTDLVAHRVGARAGMTCAWGPDGEGAAGTSLCHAGGHRLRRRRGCSLGRPGAQVAGEGVRTERAAGLRALRNLSSGVTEHRFHTF